MTFLIKDLKQFEALLKYEICITFLFILINLNPKTFFFDSCFCQPWQATYWDSPGDKLRVEVLLGAEQARDHGADQAVVLIEVILDWSSS